MDNYLSKLKSNLTTTLHSTIGSTVNNLNQLSNLLPGNKITREFEILNDEWTSGGNQLCWKICDAVKKSTNQKASIFVLEKKSLDGYNRKDRELILDSLRKSVQQLTRLRHPAILKVEHPLEESRDCIAFACEPVFCSLANTLGKTENMSMPAPKELENYQLIDLEIQYGLFQISEAVSFLHNDVKLLHRNICPENIIITKRGAWKLFGFEFCAQPNSPDETPLTFPLLVVNQTKDFPQLLLPSLLYLPPEYYQENEDQRRILLSSDMYQLGFLTFNLFSRADKSHPLLRHSISLSQLNQLRIQEIEQLISNYNSTLKRVPEDSRFQIKSLLSVDQHSRPNIVQYQKLALFEDVQVRTLQYLDSIFKMDSLEKVKFYKGLPEILELMPKRVKVDRIMSELAKEFVNPEMTVFVLPNYLSILKEIDDEKEFTDYCLPQLNLVFQMKDPIQVSIILMQNIELLLLKCKKNQETIRNYILPMVCRCFDQNNSAEVQDLCLQSVPNICYLVEQTSIKNALLPKIKKLCLASTDKSMKVKCLLCIGKIITHLDKWVVIDDVINFLPEVNSREAGCIMACIGIYQLSFNHEKLGLTKEVICNRAVPHMLSLSIENHLNTNQFETILSLVRQMIQSVEEEHKAKLKQMDSMKSQQEMALVSFNRSNHINSQNILKSLDEITYENSARLSGNTNVLVNSNSPNSHSNNGTTRPSLHSMANSNATAKPSKPEAFLKDLTSTLTQNSSQPSTGKKVPDYSHLVNLDLGGNKIGKSKSSALDSLPVFPSMDAPKPTGLSGPFGQLQLTNFPANQMSQPSFGQLQSSSMISPQVLSIGGGKQATTGQYKLSKNELEDFLN